MHVVTQSSSSFVINPEKFNPVFLPYVNAPQSIQLLTGNRGSGKSVFAHQKALVYAMVKKYFRLAFGRKIADTIRDSMFQGFKDLIIEWGLQNYFQIKEGSMDIICRLNGNMLLSFGLDDPAKLKALKDITHVYVDEMTEVTFQDYAALRALLRTSKARYKQFWGLFNPEYGFWAREYFFLDSESDVIPLGEIPALTHDTLIYKATFKDNRFIDAEDYERNLRELARGDNNYITVWIDGNWGDLVTGNEYFTAYNMAIHVRDVPFIPNKPVHLSFDFNVVPFMTGLCFQVNITQTAFELRLFREYCLPSPMNTTEAICTTFITDYIDRTPDVFYYGDASGQNRIAGRGNETAFDDVEKVLYRHTGTASKRVLKYNPSVLKRRDFMNDILSGRVKYNGLPVVFMMDKSCKETREDMQKLKLGVDGKAKERVHDKQKGISYEKRGHPSDAAEYFVIRLLWAIFKQD